jgi:hypothetical protein
MVALLAFADGQSFATGASKYEYIPATRLETHVRIMLQVELEGIKTQAMLDTGAPYVVISPRLVPLLNLPPALALEQIVLNIRGSSVSGDLYRVGLLFTATQGEPLTIDATVFIPHVELDQDWSRFPSFIGLNGCLERMRFAVDPAADTFYFGGLI